jgi:hypothetical protein
MQDNRLLIDYSPKGLGTYDDCELGPRESFEIYESRNGIVVPNLCFGRGGRRLKIRNRRKPPRTKIIRLGSRSRYNDFDYSLHYTTPEEDC